MSRAVNINAPSEEVLALCATKSIATTAIETLLSGGTRVVLMNAVDARTVSVAFKTKLIAGPVKRRTLTRRG